MNIREIKKEAIKHYNRMIEWAKIQNPEEAVDYYLMEVAIGEDWWAGYCPFCKNFGCMVCPLNTEFEKTQDQNHYDPDKRNDYYGSSKNCCEGLWSKMSKSETWKEWIKNAGKVRAYIRKIDVG